MGRKAIGRHWHSSNGFHAEDVRKEELWEFANKLFWTLALVVAVITVLGMVFSPYVIHLFTSDVGSAGGLDLAVELNRIIFPYLFFVAMAALAMGILNCFHVFGLPAATPVFWNLASILFSIAISQVLLGLAVAALLVSGVRMEFPPIKLERTRDTKLSHKDGTISMARDGPDTATSDFFICIGDQPELDFGGKRNPDRQGFAAFGRVVKGMDVVKKIQAAKATGQTLTPAVKIFRIYRFRKTD